MIIIQCYKFCNRTFNKIFSAGSLSRVVKECFTEEGNISVVSKDLKFLWRKGTRNLKKKNP